MKAYLLLEFARRARQLPLEEFLVKSPGEWLIWEPGRWRPVGNRPGTIAYEPPTIAEPPGGEALAIKLELLPGRADVRLGRVPESDISIDDATVSRTHLVFKRTQHTWRLSDPGSSNGSTIDGKKLYEGQELPLSDGSRITAGGVRLTYHDARGFYWRIRSMT